MKANFKRCMKRYEKEVLLICFFLFSGICFAQQSWQYKFFEGQEIMYAFEAIPRTFVFSLERATLFSYKRNLVGQFYEKVEKQISSDSYKIYVKFDLEKINGLPPANYHPACNRVLVKTNGFLLKSESAGYAWLEPRKKNTFFSLADYQSPNFSYQLPKGKIASETPFLIIEAPLYIMNDAIILVIPKIEGDLVRLSYVFLGIDSKERFFTLYSGLGQIVLSQNTGLLLSNESEFFTIFKTGEGFASCFNVTFFPFSLRMVNEE
jgi:hypothetical protein